MDVTTDGHSEVRWSGFVASLPSPCTVFTFTAAPLKGTGLVRIDHGLAFALVDRLFGGKGESGDLGRELTAIERQTVGKFVDRILADGESVWKQAFDLKFSRGGFASSPDLIETGGVDEPVIVVEFELKTGPTSGSFNRITFIR